MDKRFIRIIFCLIPAAASFAGLPFTGPDLWLTQKGDVLFSENFSAGLDTNRWATAKGAWNVKNGILTGSELATDHHAASIRTDVPFENAVLQFDFKLDGSEGFSLSANEASGHHSRILISTDGISLQKDRDKKDPRSLSLPLARQNFAFKQGVWYTVTVEYCGKDLLAHVNKQTFVLGSHNKMGSQKINFGFPVRGTSASFGNITVWAATPKADLNAVKGKLLALQTARDSTPGNPRTAYIEAETRLRDQLMKSDPVFNQLVDGRIAIDNELHKRWPKAFRQGTAGMEVKKALLAEDPEFKTMNFALPKARKAELDYLLKQKPELAELRKAMIEASKSK